MIRKTIVLYNILGMLMAFAAASHAAIYVLFLMAHGLNLIEVNLINVAFFVMWTLMEIPTGTVADVFGRKPSYIISCALYALGMFVYAAGDSFSWFIAAEMIAAIGATFASGAFDAWVADRLKHFGHTESLAPLNAQHSLLKSGVSIVGAIVGASLYGINMAIPWALGGVVALIAGLVAALCMREEYFTPPTERGVRAQKIALAKTVRASMAYARTNASFRFVALMVAAYHIATMAMNMQWAPRFEPHLPFDSAKGLVFAAIAVFSMIGAAIARHVAPRIVNERRAIMLSLFGTAVAMILAGATPVLIPSLAFFLLHEVGRYAFFPFKDAYLQRELPTKERATILSIESMIGKGAGAIGLVASGLLAEYGSISLSWICSGAFLAIAMLLLWRSAHHTTTSP